MGKITDEFQIRKNGTLKKNDDNNDKLKIQEKAHSPVMLKYVE